MTSKKHIGGTVRVGIGGWTFAPWRDTFYPPKLPHARELAHASRVVTSIEVNGTYYRTQSPESFRRWAAETPDDFVFALKASRYATNRKDLGSAGEAVSHFVGSGITELGSKLGPILWQLAPTKAFDAEEIGRFLALLPPEAGGLPLRHVLEVRHQSFKSAAFATLAARHGTAICLAVSDDYPLIADPTADFIYMRLQTSTGEHEAGYTADAIGRFATQARTFAGGGMPDDLPTLAPAKKTAGRDFASSTSLAARRSAIRPPPRRC